jgi:DNA mismatch endonuclease (patch repair protein)
MTDPLTPQQRSKCMSRIKSNNTSIELLLRKALWREGIRFRKNVKTLPGSPDIVIAKYKIAIFCDGELWHGKDWETKTKENIRTRRDYWIPKIERNIERDNRIDRELENMGWVVLRFWGAGIKKNVTGCVKEIKDVIYDIKHGLYRVECDKADNLFVAEDETEYN